MKDSDMLMALASLQPRHTTEYVTREVNVHRAPTDKSVALLKEMEQAARDKVLETIRLENNGFEAVCHRMVNYADNDTIWKCIYSLNDKRFETTVRLSDRRDPMDVVDMLRDEMAKDIAAAILAPALVAAWPKR